MLLVALLSLIAVVSSGAVGKCRTECVEQNQYKIVRVHLKDDLVMAGICRNSTELHGTLSTIIPFVCKRDEGVWVFDVNDEEGIVPFQIRCPKNIPVTPEQLLACPAASPVL